MPKFAIPKFNIAHKPNLPDLEEFKAFVAKKVGDTTKIKLLPCEDIYRKYYDRVVEEWGRKKTLEHLPPKIFNKIPVFAAISFDGQPKLIDNDKFRQAWLALMAKRKNARHARKIYRCVLRNYNSYQPYLEHIFAYVKPLIKSSTLPLCKKLSALDDRYGLLTHALVENITTHILRHTDKSIDDILLAMGIVGSLREAELSAVVGRKILAQNSKRLRNEDDSMLARTFEYFKNATTDDHKLRLEYMRNDMLKSLLGNYFEKEPSEKIKEQLEAFTDRYLGDPRADPRWHGVEENIRRVVVRWKVGLTLKTFFKLLDHAARLDKTHDRHWQARKKFWQDYLDRGKITGAWVVLGKNYLDNHNVLLADNLKFAKFLNSTGIKNSHCAIIMRVNNSVLTEWSHVGGLRIWKAGDERAPQLYQDSYAPQSLKNMKISEDGYIRHQANWQEKARSILEGETTFRRW